MTGKDLLDAIGYVDQSLLEHCQGAEPNTTKNNILWIWHKRKYVSIAACACLFLAFILGITYWQYHISSIGDGLLHGDACVMTALLDNCHPERLTPVQEAKVQDGKDSTKKEKRSNGIDSGSGEKDQNKISQDSKSGDIYNAGNQPGSDITPDSEKSYGGEGIDAVPGDLGNADISEAPDTVIAKIDKTGMTDYSQGITIRAVTEFPDREPQPQPEEPSPPNSDGIKHPDGIVLARKIFAENTAIVRGTVKRIQHYHASGGKIDVYFSVVSLKVKEVYRTDGKGGPKKGSICKVYLPDTRNSVRTDTAILRKLKKEREAVIMPYIADAKTGIRSGKNFFAFSDVADYYFDAKTADSHLFLKTRTDVLYNTKIYDIPYSGKKVNLKDVEAYIRNMLKKFA